MKNAKIKILGNVFVLALALAGGVGVVGALIAIKNISTVQDTWDTFELGRPEKLRILGALRKEIGYGGMIHQFKNYVLRQDAARIGAINSKLSGVSAAISRYRALDLDGAESAALADIEKVIGEYSRNLLTASNLVKRGRPPRDIDRLVKIDDLPALEGLRVLENQARRRPQTGTAVTSKIQIVASVRKSLGYGGMIHQFKNYILRQDQDGIDAVGEHLDAARLALAQYLQHPLIPVAISHDTIAHSLRVIEAILSGL
ncbi:MAG: hypothetical protein QF512_21280, partial [Alphaproteobacteria bacterium]|nr:hypothetical protein [Alphaproteobacteria bacterium]